MGDENPIRTLGDYSKPSHEGYRNTIELPIGNNVSEDPNQHLKDFLKVVDSLDLDAGSITTWEDLTTRFLAQFFPPGRTAKLRNDILMFQQHHGESLSEAWTRFKDLLQKVPHHGIDLWLQDEGWNNPVFPEEEILDYKNPNIEQLLGVMVSKVDMLMENAISLMGRIEDVCDMMHQLQPEPSCQEAFKDLVMNFIHDQEEKVKQLEEYMYVTGSDFMQVSLEVIERLKEEIRIKENGVKKIEKIMRYSDTEDLEPLNGHEFSKALTRNASSHTPKFVSPKSLCVKHIRIIFPSPSLVRESTFGFKPGANNNSFHPKNVRFTFRYLGIRVSIIDTQDDSTFRNFELRYSAFGRHLEKIHVTWAHLEKKQTRLWTYTNISQDYVLSGWRRRHKIHVTPSQHIP
ncbi:zinc finger, CCHC-type containing protein [Tanacetum coccineum]|uniref:Zinc finger, CCHC-type containing protein n=1 Tax=Tanacetum coccineum TaxID=301880 RepID=A0ABQ5CLF6_9ASTR